LLLNLAFQEKYHFFFSKTKEILIGLVDLGNYFYPLYRLVFLKLMFIFGRNYSTGVLWTKIIRQLADN